MESRLHNLRSSTSQQIKSEPGKELLTIRTRSRVQSLKTSLLQNGSILPSVRMDNKNIKILNTCPFDVILQILLVAYLDNRVYKNAIKKNIKHEFFEIIANYAKNGLTNNIYLKRASMLCQLYPAVNNSINCNDNANVIIEKFFKDIPSIIESSKCINCNYKIKKNIPLLHVDAKFILENGMKIGLQQSIVEILEAKNVQCLKCNLYTLLVARKPGAHLFLDVEHVYMPFVMKTLGFNKTVKSIDLDEFPKEIQIERCSYQLNGLIFHQKAFGKLGIGHYIAYCLRSNGVWEEHDDMTHAVINLRFKGDKQISHSLSTIVLTKQ